MFTTKKKIQKDKDAEPTEFEETVAQVRSLGFYSSTLDSWINWVVYDVFYMLFLCRLYLIWKIAIQTWKVS